MTVPVDRDRLRRTTAPHLLCERARTMPDSVAFRSKHFGIYRERRWRDYAALVAHAARAVTDGIALVGSRHPLIDAHQRLSSTSPTVDSGLAGRARKTAGRYC